MGRRPGARVCAELADVGRVDLSVTAWRRAADVTRTPQDYDRLGLSWAMLGRPADAVGPLEEAVRRAPTSASIRMNYAVTLYAVGRYKTRPAARPSTC